MYENMKALMGAKGISIETLAKLLGLHRDTVTNKLNGESEFTYGQAELIQEVLFPEYNIRYLFRRTQSA
ncbi:MAG: helix-turn-helix transcriptional regulator [Clostridiales bacterium]|nr:helix-turn-helix transcriptional regulator [Clostridiales bacterium]